MSSGRNSLRAAIVGAGLMGRWHAHYASGAGAEIAAIVDADRQTAENLRVRFRRASVWPGLEQCLENVRIDVVHLCTPTRSHFSLSKLAIEKRVHVLVEKPAASSTTEAENLVAASRRSGVKIAPVHQFPFQRGFADLRRRRQTLGEPVRVSFETCTAGGDRLPSPARDNVLIEITPHVTALFMALFGSDLTQAVHIHEQSADLLRFDSITADGGRLEAFLTLRGRPTINRLTYVGTNGSAHVDLYHGYCVWEPGAVGRSSKAMRPLRLGLNLLTASSLNLAHRVVRSEWAYPGLGELVREFYLSIRKGSESPVSDAELVASVRLVERLQANLQGAPQPAAGR